MLVLAVETSTLTGSVALMQSPPDGKAAKIIGEHILNLESTHSRQLMPSIDHLLQEASFSIRDVEGIALALGPGSFTGLRIGVSTVKGLAFALRVPVAGVPTLDGLARNISFPSPLICAVLDARKKEVFAALFRCKDGGDELQKLSPDWVLPPRDLCTRIHEETIFVGNGIEVYGDFFRRELGPLALFAPPELCLPRASNIARLSLPKFKAGETLDLFSFTPVYIRRSDAEVHFKGKEPQGI